VSTFSHTVSALVYSLISDRCAGAQSAGMFLNNEVTRFVLEQHSNTPDYMRLPLRLLTLIFNAWSLPTYGRTFHRLAPEYRLRQIDRWRASRIGARRDFIRYYEGLTVFGWYAFYHEHGQQ
jgi:hypothetical protein